MSATQAKMASKIERVVSPGGISAWLVEEHTVPLISMEFAFRGGAAQDESEKAGTATLLAGLLDEGAGDLDGQAYQEKLEESAVELHFSAGRDSFDGSLKCLADKRVEAFELLRLAVTEARLEAEDFERIRQQILARIRRDSTDPGDVAYETWAAQAFPGHPYGQRPHGSEMSVAAIARDDLLAFRTANFARSNLVIAVVGAIDGATLGPVLDLVFGALPAEPKLKTVKAAAPQNIGHTEVIDMDIPQTTIVFGRGGLVRDDPDYIPAVVMNHILGGGTFTSRLFNEVREKRGLAYSVYSYLDPMEHAGVIGGGVATKNERAAEALELIESEFARFAKEGPTADELAKAKLYLMGSYALNFDSSVKVARGLKQIQLTRLPVDYIDERNALVDAVTVEDVKRVAARILGDGDLLVAAAGRPVGFRAGRAGAPARETKAAGSR
ncbi:peptidase M16 [Terrihabitans soli]|uniref:Peptidase M16 n=1 Tax=Terrihabitans soli TaxID=708113 RepID=A0A6S6QX95_9HYPH|nr:pitrilysin family protein [Terrihabitans soli]BCJ91660.1 peptidase M16 [Terrihabitans soli]